MKSRRNVFSVVQGGGEAPIAEPDWSRSFADGWEADGVKLAHEAWLSLKARRVLTPQNTDRVQIYCVNIARWKMAEAAAAKAPVVAGKSGPMVSPMLQIANQAATIALKIDAGFKPRAATDAGGGDLRSRIAALGNTRR